MKTYIILSAALSLFSTSVYAQSAVVAGEFIVKMKTSSGKTSNASLSKGLGIVGKMGSAIAVKQAFWGSRMLHIQSNSSAAIEILRANPDVEFIEPNYRLTIDPVDVQPFGTPPGSTDEYAQSNANVQVTESWAVAKPYNQGNKTIVAVIDTGVDINHGLFQDARAVWENAAEKNGAAGVDDDGNGYVDDINGWNYVGRNGNVIDDDDHGTHVAGIILGVGQDILQYPVRESRVKIMALKFLDSSGAGTTADAVSAMYYAVNMGAKVINNSWGGSSYSKSLHDAYSYAHSHGVFIASAAGNSGTNNDSTPMYPAALDTPNNVAVAASTDSDNKASFSNYGTSVHVAAPGVAIISAVPGFGCLAPGCFQMMSGTSMASPFVAGLAALIVREAPQLSGFQIRSIVMSSIDSKSGLNGKVLTAGRVNALKAVQAAIGQANASPYNPAYSPSYKSERTVASAAPEQAPGGCGLVGSAGLASAFGQGSGPTSGGGNLGNIFAVLLMALIPVSVAVAYRARAKVADVAPEQRRKYARYNITKDMVVRVGDQVLNCASDSISLGGVSFSAADIAIDKGAKIKVKIGGLDQEVEGEVVWCSQKQSYGVKFLDITEQLKEHFSSWTVGLSPT